MGIFDEKADLSIISSCAGRPVRHTAGNDGVGDVVSTNVVLEATEWEQSPFYYSRLPRISVDNHARSNVLGFCKDSTHLRGVPLVSGSFKARLQFRIDTLKGRLQSLGRVVFGIWVVCGFECCDLLFPNLDHLLHCFSLAFITVRMTRRSGFGKPLAVIATTDRNVFSVESFDLIEYFVYCVGHVNSSYRSLEIKKSDVRNWSVNISLSPVHNKTNFGEHPDLSHALSGTQSEIGVVEAADFHRPLKRRLSGSSRLFSLRILFVSLFDRIEKNHISDRKRDR